METFLRDVEAKLAGMTPDQRTAEMGRLVQLFRAVQYMRHLFQFKGGGRMVAWVGEQVIAKATPAEVGRKMRAKAELLKLTYVLQLIDAAAEAS